jgi:DUF917 family protein
MQILNHQELIDILHGCAILGTGGGGELDEGIAYIDEALALEKTFKLTSVDEVPAGEYVCTSYILGAISPLSAEEELAYIKQTRTLLLRLINVYSHIRGKLFTARFVMN